MKIGMGFDMHKLVDRRKLILGGVEVPYYRGLLGNTDADVLLHAICDAILGALGDGDIGRHFPPGDPQYTDMASGELLGKVVAMARAKGLAVSNLDSTIMAEKPKLSEHIPQMAGNIAGILGVGVERVNVKATTTDGQGPIGTGAAIAAQAVVLLVPSGQVPAPAAPPPRPAPAAPTQAETPPSGGGSKDFFELG